MVAGGVLGGGGGGISKFSGGGGDFPHPTSRENPAIICYHVLPSGWV